MPRNFEKFLFLGVVFFATMFAPGHSRRISEPEPASTASLVELPRQELGTSEVLARAPVPPVSESAPDQAALRSRAAPAHIFPKGEISPPHVDAASVMVGNLTTGETYFSVAPEKRWPLASLTKLMTAAVALTHASSESEIAVADSDFRAEGGSGFVKAGERYRVPDLLKLMLMPSSNEAANALARLAGGDSFVLAMNQKARSWGLSETSFSDPTGLSSANQSTARDVAKLTVRLYESYPEIFGVTQDSVAVIREASSGEAREVRSIHPFAGSPDFLGGKTGYTDVAGGNLLSVFSYRDRPIVIIVFGAENRFEATKALRSWFRDAFDAEELKSGE